MQESKIGVFNSSVLAAADNDPFKSLDLIAEMGFKGFCANAANRPPFADLPAAEQRRFLTDYARSLGLTVSALACNISSEAEARGDVEQRMQPLRAALDLAAECGVPIVIVHGGERMVDDEAANQAAWARLVENMKHGGAYAADKGLRLAMEPGGGFWMVHGWRLLSRLREEVGDTFFVNLDPANVVMACEDPVEGVRKLGDAIIHLHLKDARIVKPAEHVRAFVAGLDDTASDINFAAWKAALEADSADGVRFWEEVPVGEGDVDFAAFMAALGEIGYDGWMGIEREGNQDRDKKIADVTRARDHVTEILTAR